LTIDEVQHRLRILERLVAVLRETDSFYPKWKAMVSAHLVSGKQVHDARIAALMSAHRVRRILTLNPTDFTRYPHIQVHTPAEVLAT
jgi:predicted nucleic acid-binding protein